MPVAYTGDLTKVHAPDLGPAVGRMPIINIPVNGDPNNADTWRQAYMTLADYLSFLQTQIGPATPPYFGDGSDGPATISGSTTISGVVKNYTDLTIGASGILTANRSIIRVTGTLTITSGGVIKANGGNASGATAGAGTDGIGAAITTPCPLSGGTSGASGFTAGGAAGKDFAIAGNTLGLVQNAELAYVGYSAKGGAGGLGSGGAGGNPGCNSAGADDLIATDLLFGSIFTPGFAYRTRFASHGGGDTGSFAEVAPVRGGSGGGAGGGDGAASGGGSGAGGGVIYVFAKTVVLSAVSCIQALGGNGGNAGGTNVGGGGGGGGGRVFLIHGGLTGTALTTACVAGGTGGTKTGTGVAGSTGATGTLFVKQIA